MIVTTGSKISHYEILAPLGAGGMGEVYLAQDDQLKRKLALKFLPQQYTDHSDRLRRFYQEAQAASALNHPNIITIYEIGMEGASHYIATEFIDGHTLRKHIKGRTLGIGEALDITVQIASALSAAHGAGIIHRDIKPENVMLRQDGIVKVLDFGLAKLLETETDTTDPDAATLVQFTTEAGAVIGTPQYMSPEQARGQKVDTGTDIFSLGVVLYEMVAGRPPFVGVNSFDVISAILQKEPAPVSQLVPGLPAGLDHIVSRMLNKDRGQRYQSIDDALAELRALRETVAFASRQERLSTGLPESRKLSGFSFDAAQTATAVADPGAIYSGTLQNGSTGVSCPSSVKQSLGLWLKEHRAIATLAGCLILASLAAAYYFHSIRTAGHRPSAEAKRWFDIGAKGLRDGAFYQAGKAFEKAIAADDAFILARARLAEAFVEQDLIERAKDELLRVNTADRSAFSVLDSLYLDAVIATATTNFPKAIENYRQILRQASDTEKPYVLVDLARALEKNQDLKQAVSSCQEAVKLSPEYATAFLRLGVLFGIQRDLAKGMSAFDRADVLYQAEGNLEGRAEVAVQRGSLLNKVNKLADARSALERALALTRASENKSQEINALLQLSGVVADLGETEPAMNYAREALELARTNHMETLTARGLVDLGNAFRSAGKNAEAETAFKQSLEASQSSKAHKPEARAQLSLASLYVQQNKIEQAERYLAPALTFYQQGGYQTEAFQGLILLARLNRNKGDFDAAIKASEQLLQIATQRNDQSLIASAHSEWGAILLARGNYPEALKHQKEAGQLYRTLGVQRSLAYNLASQGNALLRLGRFDEAETSLAEAKTIADRPTGGYPDLTVLVKLASAEIAQIKGNHARCEAIAKEVLELKVGQSSTSTIMAKRLFGLAQAQGGNSAAGIRQAVEAVELSRQLPEPGVLAHSQLYLAESQLLGGDSKEALKNASQALSFFERNLVISLTWRALAVAALASQKEGDRAGAAKSAGLAMQILANLDQSWGPGDAALFRLRPDVDEMKKRIATLVETPR